MFLQSCVIIVFIIHEVNPGLRKKKTILLLFKNVEK
jgi:hypothetical protein